MKQKTFNSKIVRAALRAAKAVRLSSDYKFFRMGSCIFTSKRILVSGANVNKTSPMQGEYNKYRPFDTRHMRSCCHAEMSALIRFKRLYPDIDGSDVSILVYRETADGCYAMAKPCPACEHALRDAGITNIYYTDRNKLCYEKYL